MSDNKTRCEWSTHHKIDQDYHDEEWGVPVYDDRKLFEMLCLEGQQAGMNWHMILLKRKNYQELFENFEAEAIIEFNDDYVEALMQEKGIIRNKLKIKAIISNAKAYLKVKEEFGTFKEYIWQFTDYKVIQNNWKTMEEVPTKTDISDRMSKDLKKRGFKFVGSITCYAYMQGVGMINDHTVDCFRHKEVQKLARPRA
ncbi:DNA-3-methyladenine glycosylase I [Flammeovirga sp. EKP202]|uniref:DNA-3-methyladenine glycosylase I n=1 Tax=Flammeovirga sp. EKP202 TaxID=2770592 RepID=UPI00165F7CFE|nr:DNA-3-methyladenine glycosylase I [Flammeovirga sp. EKP202]MBD0402799.1 DNA-3-methyladenine glycosylase I [Flammeovirga sp. EKP202]